jgi:Fur family transcriptional regulator, peroxide stress response regulator
MRAEQREIGLRIQELTGRCREAGLAVTPQRLAVYRALLESDDHPTPDMLHARVRRTMPSMSLATIYKALDTLEKLGVIREVHVFSDVSRFDANLDHHHHLVCVDCKRVIDYYDESLSTLTPRRISGFVPESVAVRILGKCSDCAAKSRGSSETVHERRSQR